MTIQEFLTETINDFLEEKEEAIVDLINKKEESK